VAEQDWAMAVDISVVSCFLGWFGVDVQIGLMLFKDNQ
jgi:hypothetical protein